MKVKYKPIIDGKKLYSWGWSCARAAAAIGITSSHLGYCLRGERRRYNPNGVYSSCGEEVSGGERKKSEKKCKKSEN